MTQYLTYTEQLDNVAWGSEGKASRKLAAGAGALVLTGQDVGLRASRKLAADVGEFALNGQDVGLRASRKLPAEAGAFVLDGQDVALIFIANDNPSSLIFTRRRRRA